MRYGVDTLPHVRCIKKRSVECIGARRQNLSRLRVEKLRCVTRSWPCLVTGLRVGRQVGPAVKPEASTGMPACPRLYPVGQTSLTRSPQSPYLPKTAFAALANLQSEDLTF